MDLVTALEVTDVARVDGTREELGDCHGEGSQEESRGESGDGASEHCVKGGWFAEKLRAVSSDGLRC